MTTTKRRRGSIRLLPPPYDRVIGMPPPPSPGTSTHRRRVVLEVVPEGRIGFDSSQMWRDTPDAARQDDQPLRPCSKLFEHGRIAGRPHHIEVPFLHAPAARRCARTDRDSDQRW